MILLLPFFMFYAIMYLENMVFFITNHNFIQTINEVIMINCKDLYLDLNGKLHNVIEDTLINDNMKIHAISHQFIVDFEKWINQLSNNDEVILYRSALIEYQYSLLFVAQGLYRQAFNSLRFCLEHTLFGIYLSTSELNFRRWKSGNFDVYWSMITDENQGIFSKLFIDVFNAEFSDRSTELRELAKLVYRECSEFTHGNYKAALMISEAIKFDNSLYNLWQDKADSVRYLITVIFFIRYYEKIQSNDIAIELESSIVEYIGTLPQVQLFYNIIKRGK